MKEAAPAKGKFSRVWVIALAVLAVLFLDQLSKYLVRANIPLGQTFPHDWPIRFTNVYNTGAAFGIFPNGSFVLIIVSFVAIGVMLFFYRTHALPGTLTRVTLGMQLGGAIGNLSDRIRFGQVTDFIDFRVWPVFNVADSAVVIGIAILVWMILNNDAKSAKKLEKKPTDSSTQPTP